MNGKSLILLALSGALLTACAPSRDKQLGQISSMESRLFSPAATGFSQASADSLVDLYARFAKRFPSDSMAPHYLFKAGGVSMNLREGAKAIGFYDKILADYPAYSRAPLCLFFKGYVQENVMRNLDQAKETYLVFLEKYPNSDFADDAKAALQNLGKSPEQMVREFDARKKADSLASAGK
jgi:outer membrane protein assembly factor BamD (BamD/ComL family)